INPFLLSVPCAVFGRTPGFNLQVCAAEPGTLRSDAGFVIVCARGLAGLARAELIVVPGWRDPAEVPPPALLAALRRAHARGAQI
ncbi:GlxA family transcriptional regulator, partial [Acinetobacter baumannii]